MMKFEVMVGDSRKLLKRLKKDSVHCCVTSPPYFGHRDYKNKKQIGREKTPEEYIEHLVAVFREVHRVLRPDGTLWVNIGDSYASGWSCSRRNVVGNGTTNEGRSGRLNRLTGDLKDKDLIGIPWMLAFALRADGWYLRAENLWIKSNPMPESVLDRTTRAHEQIFMLTKSRKYYYDWEAIAEPCHGSHTSHTVQNGAHHDATGHTGKSLRKVVTKATKPSGEYQSLSGRNDGSLHRSGGFVNTKGTRFHGSKAGLKSGAGGDRNDGGRAQTGEALEIKNKRSAWHIKMTPFGEAHFATFPSGLPKICMLAGSPKGGTVLDPFSGAATTGIVALRNGRHYVGVELNEEYAAMSVERYKRNRYAVGEW